MAADVDAGLAGHHCSYVYLGRGMTDKTATADALVAYEPLNNHGDGHVRAGTPVHFC